MAVFYGSVAPIRTAHLRNIISIRRPSLYGEGAEVCIPHSGRRRLQIVTNQLKDADRLRAYRETESRSCQLSFDVEASG